MSKGDHKKIKTLLKPRTIAVIGASQDETKVGNIVVRNLDKFGFKGEIFIVNPHLPDVYQHRSFAFYAELPLVPDLAVIAIPAKLVPSVLKEVAQKGTKNVLIFSAGFKEVGNEGEVLQNELVDIANKYNLNILGPNCLGYVNMGANINATFGQVTKKPGNIRFISQSGAIATSMFDWAAQSEIGFREFITIGNKAVISENEIIEHWLGEEISTRELQYNVSRGFSSNVPVGLYLESISDGKKLIKLLSRLSKTSPVVVLKPGKTEAAEKAMMSHTGAIAGDDAVVGAALSMAGAIRADGIEDLFDLLKIFSWENAPKNANVAIVSNAGGPSVIATDALQENNLNLAPLSKSTQKLLHKLLPREAATHNPVDVLGDAGAARYHDALEVVLKDKSVGSVIAILTPQVMTQIRETAEIISKLSKKYKKTIVCSFMGGVQSDAGERILNESKIPSYRFPERAARALGKMVKWAELKKERAITNDGVQHLSKSSLGRIDNYVSKIKNTRSLISGYEVNEILSASGIKLPPYSLAASYPDAAEFAHRFEYPVALKITSPYIVHKTDIGGVFPKISNSDELSVSFKKLQKIVDEYELKNKDAGIMIQKSVPEGLQIIVGVKKDPNFGRFLLIGAGGIFTDLLPDKKIIIMPASKDKIIELIGKTKIGKILNGYRTGRSYSLDLLVKIILILDEIIAKSEKIIEIEINPAIITESDMYIVDGRAFI